jgi:hypothetical protein
MDGPRSEFEQLRDSGPTGDETRDLVRQFLRGDPTGPITRRRRDTGYTEEILAMGGWG